jgi:hypothetical protein
MATLTITVPDAVLTRLRERASERGTTPEAVAADDVTRATLPPGYGRLRRLAGSVPLGRPDVSARCDEVLGDALHDELRGRSGD